MRFFHHRFGFEVKFLHHRIRFEVRIFQSQDCWYKARLDPCKELKPTNGSKPFNCSSLIAVAISHTRTFIVWDFRVDGSELRIYALCFMVQG